MKNKFLKKTLIVTVIFSLVMVSIPMVSGDWHMYPKEDGPYTIFASGKIGSVTMSDAFRNQTLPFWDLEDDEIIGFILYRIPFIFVNGKLQIIKPPFKVIIFGFKGYCPTYSMLDNRKFVGRANIIGEAEQLWVVEII